MRIVQVAGGLMMALALAGCQRTSMGGVDTQPTAPLQPAPVGTVSSSQLPDPSTSTSGGSDPTWAKHGKCRALRPAFS